MGQKGPPCAGCGLEGNLASGASMIAYEYVCYPLGTSRENNPRLEEIVTGKTWSTLRARMVSFLSLPPPATSTPLLSQ